MKVLSWLKSGATFLMTAVGAVLWLGSAIYLSQVVLSGSQGDGFEEQARTGALILCIWLGIVGSVLIVRLTGKLEPFLAVLLASAVLGAYGAGVLGGRTPSSNASIDLLGATEHSASGMGGFRPETARGESSTGVQKSEFDRRGQAQDGTLTLSPDENALFAGGQILLRRPDGTPYTNVPTPTTGRVTDGSAGTRTALLASRGPPTSTGSATSPATPVTVPIADQFDLQTMRFNKPARMRINKSYIVEVQIGETQIQSLGSEGPTTTRRVAVPAPEHGAVRVELISDSLEVMRLQGEDTIIVKPGTTALWSWKVTPRSEEPDQRLLLQVFGSLKRDDAVGEVLVRTFRETIPVDVTPIDRAELWGKAFLSRWDIVAGIAGAIGGIWLVISSVLAFLKRRRKNSTPMAA
ncbi:MAG: hypothetical protein IV086_10365 [Hyphomonadaceae bacterium]|nr:hypothetical protein [Hyphomonadaceae bacterium]